MVLGLCLPTKAFIDLIIIVCFWHLHFKSNHYSTIAQWIINLPHVAQWCHKALSNLVCRRWWTVTFQAPRKSICRCLQNGSHFVNSLAPGKFERKFRYIIFKWISVIDGRGISYEIALIWKSLGLTDDQSTLVQVMAWCRQATSHYLNQCWHRFISPYGITRPQWVNTYTNSNNQKQMHLFQHHKECTGLAETRISSNFKAVYHKFMLAPGHRTLSSAPYPLISIRLLI